MQNVFMQFERSVGYRAIWLCLLSVLWAPISQAETVTLSCTSPTQNTDGSALTDLAVLRFYESTASGGPYALVAEETVCTVDLDRTEGTYYYVATAVNSQGDESDYSGEASKTVAGVPEPPTGLVILDSDLVAYGISQTLDALVLYPVGTAAPGTPCDGTMTVNGKYRIPWASVVFVGSVKPYVVLASCGSGT